MNGNTGWLRRRRAGEGAGSGRGAGGGRGRRRERLRHRFRPVFSLLEDRCLLSTTFTVTSTDDSAPASNPTQGTLRWAVEQADATSGGATINFNLSTPATIKLAQGELDLSNTITIDGPGASNLTVQGTSSSRVLAMGSVTVAISGLTIANGTAPGSGDGGGMNNNHGTLTVTACTFTGDSANTGGAIYNAGLLTVSDSTFAGNTGAAFGAALQNDGTATVTDSTFSNNSASDGGGAISNRFHLTVSGCTFNGNNVGSIGRGGAIDNYFATANITNSTFVNNSAALGGGLDNYYSSSAPGASHAVATLTDVTMTGSSGGGIDNEGDTSGDLTLDNSLIAGNGGGDVIGLVNSFNSTYNLIGDGSQMFGISNGSNGNQVGTSSNPINAKLGSLASNGGPTQTLALLAGSPALGGGSGAATTDTDQRGVLRGHILDIGAYQATATQLTVAGFPSPTAPGASHTLTVSAVDPFGQPMLDLNGPVTFSSSDPSATLPTGQSLVAGQGTFNATLRTTGVQSITASAGGLSGSQTGITVGNPPVANNDSYSINENTVLTVAAPGVLANDTDPQGNPLTAVLATGPAHGSLTLNSDGSFSYTPANNYYGADSFTYQAYDGQAYSGVATVSITVNRVNQTPVASNDRYTMAGNTTLTVNAPGVLANDTDPDGDALTAVLAAGPSHGTLTLNTDGSFSYTPATNFLGTDSFTYQASDGLVDSNVATVTLTVGQPPVANNDSYVTQENTTLTVSGLGLSSGSLLRYLFDEAGSGTATAVDSGAAPAANGTFAGAATRTANTPQSASTGALDLTAGQGYVSGGYASKLEGLGALTLTAWIDLRSAPADQSVLMSDNPYYATAPAGNGGWELRITKPFSNSNPLSAANFALAFQVYQDEGSSANSQAATSAALNAANRWIFVAVTYDANHLMNYYVGDPANAVANAGSAGYNYGLASNSAPFEIGATAFDQNTNHTPPAWLDDVRVYGSALSAGQVDGIRREDLGRGVLANDIDPQGLPLTAALVAGPSHGALTLNSDGSFSYTPATNFYGTDSFTYKANDGSFDSNVATVTITVGRPPVANNDSYTTSENTALTINAPGVLANDTDPQGNPLTAVLVAGPAHGSLTLNGDGSFSYTPAQRYYGTDSFTYQANDGSFNSNVANVTITVKAVNEPPVVTNQTYSTNENTTLAVAAPGVLTNGSDPEGNPLTAVLVTGPTHGTLTLNGNGSFSYTPAANYYGTDSFTFKANDGQLDSNVATATLTVVHLNQPPVAYNQNYATAENTALAVAAPGVLTNDSDPNHEPLTAGLVTGPAHGSLSLNGDGSFTYTPATSFLGTDSFTYKATNLYGASSTATVTLTVAQPPVARNDQYGFAPNTALTTFAGQTSLTMNSQAGDFIGQGKTYNFTPTNSTITSGILRDGVIISGVEIHVTAPGESWTLDFAAPSPGWLVPGTYTGATRYPFQAAGVPGLDVSGDGRGANTLTGQFTVNQAVFDASGNLVSFAASFVQYGDGSTAALTGQVDFNFTNNLPNGVLANDTDTNPGASLTAILVSPPSHGTLAFHADGSFTYTPAAGFGGTDSFTYKANDGRLDSNVATVTLTPDQPPVAHDDAYALAENSLLTAGAGPTFVTMNSQPGDYIGQGQPYDYTPANSTITASAFSNAVQISVSQPGVSWTLDFQAPYSGRLMPGIYTGATRYPSQTTGVPGLEISGEGRGSNTLTGQFTVTQAVYDTAGNLVSFAASFVQYSDGSTAALTGQVDYKSTMQQPNGVLYNDTDPDPATTLTATLVSNPSHGTLVLNRDGSFFYAPAAGFVGTDRFTYKANDGYFDSNVATVTLSVLAPPVAKNDSYTTNENTSLAVAKPGVLANDTDPNNNPLTAVLVAGPAHGTLTLNPDGSFTYTPAANFYGADSFTYQASDGVATSATATVTLNVNSPPVLAAIPDQSTAAGQALTVTLSASDPDNDPLTFTPRADTLAYGLEQQYGFHSAGDYDTNWGGRGEKWFLDAAANWYFILPDGRLYRWDGSSQATGTLVAALDPSYAADPTTLFHAPAGGGPASVSVTGTTLTVTPNAGFVGAFYVTVTVDDGHGASASGRFQVTVVSSTRPPTLAAIPDQTVAAGKSLTLTLQGSDPNGLPLTYSASVDSLAYHLKSTLGLYYPGTYYTNFYGGGEQWVQGSGGTWYYILPSGAFYRWSGSGLTGTLVAQLDPSYNANPSLLLNAQAGQGQATVSLSGATLTITPNAGFSGLLFVTATVSDGQGSASQAFTVTVTAANAPPTLGAIPDQTVAAGQSLTLTLQGNDPSGLPLTYSARVDSLAYHLKSTLGLYYPGTYYTNYYGGGEQWVQGTGGLWYYILPSGAFYQWSGSGLTGTLVAQLDPSYNANPSLLLNAQPGQGQATVSLSGSTLTITPNAGFTGILYVTATVSDANGSASQTFKVTVTS